MVKALVIALAAPIGLSFVRAASASASPAPVALSDAPEPSATNGIPATPLNSTFPAPHVRKGIVFDRWPFRLDIAEEYQDWVLVGVSCFVLMLWCLPCLCGQMRNSCSRKFTASIYTRLNVFFWVVSYVNLIIIMFTIGILPDWTVNEYFTYLMLFITWLLVHLKKMIISAGIMVGFLVFMKMSDKIRMAAGLDYVTLLHFNWREMLGLGMKKRPLELFIWKVEDLQSSSGKVYKPNDLYIECHLGDNEPMRTRVHNNAGTSCVIKESFQMNVNESESGTLMTLLVKDQSLMVSSELARLMLSTREICGIEDQTGKRKVDFMYSEDSFVCLSLLPRGKIWIAISPVEDLDEEKAPLMSRDDDLVPTC